MKPIGESGSVAALTRVCWFFEGLVVATLVAGVILSPVLLALSLALRVHSLGGRVVSLERELSAARSEALRAGRFDVVLDRVAASVGRGVSVADNVHPGWMTFDVALVRRPVTPRGAARMLDEAAWAHGLSVREDGANLRVERDLGPEGWRCEGALARCSVGLGSLLGVRVVADADALGRPVSLTFLAGESTVEGLRRSLGASGLSLEVQGRSVHAAPSTPVPEPAVPVCAPTDPAVRPLGRDRYAVSRAGLECLLTSSPLQRSSRVLPVTREGRVVGVAVYGISPGGPAWRLGLRDGDVLLRVNGRELASPDRCLEAYSRLRTTQQIVLELQRGSSLRTLRYVLEG